jgi:hypothetical protein
MIRVLEAPLDRFACVWAFISRQEELMFGNRYKVVAGKVTESRGGRNELSDELADRILIGRKGRRKGRINIIYNIRL